MVFGVGCGEATAIRTDSGPFHDDEGLNLSLLKKYLKNQK